MISHNTASASFQLLAPNLCAAKCNRELRKTEQYEDEIDSTMRDAGLTDITFTYTADRITVNARDAYDNARKTAFIYERTPVVVCDEMAHLNRVRNAVIAASLTSEPQYIDVIRSLKADHFQCGPHIVVCTRNHRFAIALIDTCANGHIVGDIV